MKKQELTALIEKYGKRYSELLGIHVELGNDKEIFKWFLAAVLFGAPISETSAIKTYRCFENHRVLTAKKILRIGWQGLVNILDEGGYTRYDYKTADKLLAIMGSLKAKYAGSLSLLHEKAVDSGDLEKRLKELAKGIGDITVSIFLRELRGIWNKANPHPTPLVILAAKKLCIIQSEDPEEAAKELAKFWNKNKSEDMSYVHFETMLLRLGKDMRRRQKGTTAL